MSCYLIKIIFKTMVSRALKTVNVVRAGLFAKQPMELVIVL